MTQPHHNDDDDERTPQRRWAKANPEKMREYRRRWRERNPDYKRPGQRGRGRRQEANRAFILASKDRPCADCGDQLSPERMHFDHVRGEKLFELGGNACRRSREAIKAEIAKCEVRCERCHGERHRADQLVADEKPCWNCGSVPAVRCCEWGRG